MRARSVLRPFLGGFVLAIGSQVLWAAVQAGGGTHRDPRYGFEFKPPAGWDNIALKTDEAWLAAKYLSKKVYFHTDKDTKWTSEHRPELMLIAFVHENMKRSEDVSEEKGEDGSITRTILLHNPYKSYEDYLDRTYSGGGFYVDRKEKAQHAGAQVTKYTIRVEKLTRSGPKRIVTWVYHADDVDFALQVEVLEAEYGKLESTLNRVFGSFRQIPRTKGGLPTSGRTEDSAWITIVEMDEGDPAQRKAKRMESQRRLHERAVEQLPKDWQHMSVGGILILSHTDPKHATRVGKHAQQLLAWLDSTFPFVGPGEYVRAPIVRICKNREEAGAFSRGVRAGGDGWWFSSNSEITTFKGDDGFLGWETNSLNTELYGHWLQDKDRDLWSALPEWLDGGLRAYVEGARGDGSKLAFRADDWNRDETRLAAAQGRAASARQLIQMTRQELWNSSGSDFWSYQRQSAMFVRYLLSPEARRTKQARDLLERYTKTLVAVIAEQKESAKSESPASEARPKTEEEEEAQAKARAESWRKKEEELLKEVFRRVFGDWSGSDWDALEKGWKAFLS